MNPVSCTRKCRSKHHAGCCSIVEGKGSVDTTRDCHGVLHLSYSRLNVCHNRLGEASETVLNQPARTLNVANTRQTPARLHRKTVRHSTAATGVFKRTGLASECHLTKIFPNSSFLLHFLIDRANSFKGILRLIEELLSFCVFGGVEGVFVVGQSTQGFVIGF